jgi:hypothetical protein
MPDPSRKEAPKKESPVLRCRICDKPVTVETAKTDGDGQAIHEECYALKMNLEQASSDGHAKSTRPWKVDAGEVASEKDPQKFNNLIGELDQALNEQGLDGKSKPKADGKPKDGS